MMVKFSVELKKFGKAGEKTGWTYFEIPAAQAKKIKPGFKKSFRVKGKLDNYPISRVAILPMGGGDFIMPLNAAMRKATRKHHGEKMIVILQEDKSEFIFNADFMLCLNDVPEAKKHFNTLSSSHQRYFSKWIDSAKTDATKTKRIALAINALAKQWGFPEMLRASQKAG